MLWGKHAYLFVIFECEKNWSSRSCKPLHQDLLSHLGLVLWECQNDGNSAKVPIHACYFQGVGRLWEDASSSVERRGLFPWLPTSAIQLTEMFMKWDPGEILIILNQKNKMCGNSSLSKKLKTPTNQHHGPVGPSNSRSCCTWQCDFWWPRLRPFEFAFCLSLNYNYQKYNSVSCTNTCTLDDNGAT